MFQKGMYIIYGSTGVCRVEEIGPLEQGSAADRMYYTLRPMYQSGVIYIPVDANVFMRPVLTKEEVMALIARMPDIQEAPADIRSLRMLADRYEASIRTHDCEDLVQLIKTIYQKGQAVQQTGRQLGQTDQRYFKRAEELLYGEFAVVLGLELEEVRPYLIRTIQQQLADRNGGENGEA